MSNTNFCFERKMIFLDNSSTETPQHEILKINSPLTVIFKKRHRLGQHRCAGDLLKSMAAMQKLSVGVP